MKGIWPITNFTSLVSKSAQISFFFIRMPSREWASYTSAVIPLFKRLSSYTASGDRPFPNQRKSISIDCKIETFPLGSVDESLSAWPFKSHTKCDEGATRVKAFQEDPWIDLIISKQSLLLPELSSKGIEAKKKEGLWSNLDHKAYLLHQLLEHAFDTGCCLPFVVRSFAQAFLPG